MTIHSLEKGRFDKNFYQELIRFIPVNLKIYGDNGTVIKQCQLTYKNNKTLDYTIQETKAGLSVNIPFSIGNNEFSVTISYELSRVPKLLEKIKAEIGYVLEGLTDDLYDLILVTDSNGIVMAVNNSCAHIMGIAASEIIGKPVAELEKKGIILPSAALRVLRSGTRESIIQTTASGRKLEVVGVPVYDEYGSISRIVCRSRDLSSIESIEKRLEETRLLLEKYQNDLLQMKGAAHRENFIFKSQKMQDILEVIHKIAKVDATVMLTGESGVGKEVIARLLHQLSMRNKGPFIKINCGAIPENLLESELFGYESGAFTGADKKGKAGLIELAHNGTLLLDEVAELPLNLQVKLLRVIQDKEIIRLGGIKPRKINFRIISATNRDIQEMVKRGTFREDLFYRLNVVPIYIPPLRQRRDDIEILANYFLDRFNLQYGRNKHLSKQVIKLFKEYPWYGNVRELENLIERLVILTTSDEIRINNLPDTFLNTIKDIQKEETVDAERNTLLSLEEAVAKVERDILKKALEKYRTTREMAKALKINQSTVVRKLKKYELT